MPQQYLAAAGVLVVLTCLAAFILFTRLGESRLADWDEAFYAEVASETLVTGDWITPHWNRESFFHKPPLYTWTVSLLFAIFGINEFWARFPSACSGLILVLVTFTLASAARGRHVGLLSATILLVTPGFLAAARFGTLDTMFTCFAYLAVLGYLQVTAKQPHWWYLVSCAGALAILTKSAAIFLPALPIVVGLALDRDARSSMRSRHFWLALGFALLIIVPWHAAMYARHGQAFLDSYVGINIIARATEAVDGNTADGLYYLDILRTSFFPWAYVLPIAVAFGLWTAFHGDRTTRTLACLVIGSIIVFSCLVTKLPWYIVPIYPAAAILTAIMLHGGFHYLHGGRQRLLGLTVLGALFNANLSILGPLFPQAESPFVALIHAVDDVDQQDQTLLLVNDVVLPTALFYHQGPVLGVHDLAGITAALRAQGRVYLILPENMLPMLAGCCPFEVLAQREDLVYLTLTPPPPAPLVPVGASGLSTESIVGT